jgi:hypothetical protein
MPRAPARIRRRYIDGTTEVCPWDVEETLLHGVPLIFGPPCSLVSLEDWEREWSRWREVILPKCIEHRPGTRPFAMYVVGEIKRRELMMPLPAEHGYWSVDVRMPARRIVTHWVNVPTPFMEPQITHLARLGVVDARERGRYREWINAGSDRGTVDTYPLEMSLYE